MGWALNYARRDLWSDERTGKLMEAISTGASFREAGDRCGVSRNAAIGRFKRVAAFYGAQAQ